MRAADLKTTLAAAAQVDRKGLEGIDIAAMEAELLADVDGLPTGLERGPESGRTRPRRLALLLAGAAVASAAVAILALAGGGGGQPSRAYGAQLVRFAESTPLLLLEGPGWRVQNVTEEKHGEGQIEFVTGKPVPYETLRITVGPKGDEIESGMLPAAVRQRRVELSWRHGSLEEWLSAAHRAPHPHGQAWTTAPVLDTTAHIDRRAEAFVNQGGPGDRQMTAVWSEDGYLLEMRAAVPDLAAFEERLGWLRQVDSQAWLDAMPAKVVKAADHDAAVRSMLKGIPVPHGFSPSQVPDPGLTTDRYQVGATVAGTVACLWLRQWGEARRMGDRPAEVEAVRAMATSKSWPILREMAKDGAYPETVWQLAAEMPGGYWQWAGHRHPLLPRAEGLGCARWGIPVLPRKQRLQRERRARRRAR